MHPFPARRAKQFPVSDGAVSEEVIRRFCRNNHSLSLRSLGPSAALREVDKKSLFTRPIPFLPLSLCFSGHFSPGPIINERKHIINIASLSLCCRRRGMIPHPPLHLCQSLTGERAVGRTHVMSALTLQQPLSFSSEFLHNFFHLLLPMTGPNRRRKSTCTHTAIVMPSVLTHCFSLSVGFRVMAVPETGRSPLTRSLSFHWEFISALLLEASTSLPLLKRAWKQTPLGHICPAAPRSRDKSAVCLSLPPSNQTQTPVAVVARLAHKGRQ